MNMVKLLPNDQAALTVFMRNFRSILNACSLNVFEFCNVCKSHDVNISASTLSRMKSGSTVKVSTLEDIVRGLNLIDGYSDITLSDMLVENNTLNPLSYHAKNLEMLSSICDDYIADLLDMGWIKLSAKVTPRMISQLLAQRVKKNIPPGE